jgi:hypothetical protein
MLRGAKTIAKFSVASRPSNGKVAHGLNARASSFAFATMEPSPKAPTARVKSVRNATSRWCLIVALTMVLPLGHLPSQKDLPRS